MRLVVLLCAYDLGIDQHWNMATCLFPLPSHNVSIGGARDLDPAEQKFIEENEVMWNGLPKPRISEIYRDSW